MSLSTMRLGRLPKLLGSSRTRLASRSYSVRVVGDSQPAIRTVADLNAWNPSHGQRPEVEVCGWVRNVRKASAVRFVDVIDGSSMKAMQAVVGKDDAALMRAGTAVQLRGLWVTQSESHSVTSSDRIEARYDGNEASGEKSNSNLKAPAGNNRRVAELQVADVKILGESDPNTYPIQNKYRTPESLRQIPHLRVRYPLNNNILRLRSEAIGALSRFFTQEQFLQTHPPIITSSDCEGAGEAFEVVSKSVKDHFFNGPKYLTVSSQLHLEALAQSMGNVWTLSPTFRAEHSDTSRHLSEFYMLEAEMQFVDDMEQIMQSIQDMLSFFARELSQGKAWLELDLTRQTTRIPTMTQTFADLESRDVLQRRLNGLLVSDKWPRVTYTDAVEMLRTEADRFEEAPVWGQGLRSEHERFLAEKLGFDETRNAYRPVFVTHYPRDIKAFYMPESQSSPSEGKVVDCFDLLVPDVGELLGGSMREHRLPNLIENLKHFGHTVDKKGRVPEALGWYVDLRRWGCPPHGGFGLGFDRMLSYLTGVPNVRDLVAFPRVYGRADC